MQERVKRLSIQYIFLNNEELNIYAYIQHVENVQFFATIYRKWGLDSISGFEALFGFTGATLILILS